MNLEEIINQLKSLGNEDTKKNYLNHGIHNSFGIKIADLKKFVKIIKKDQKLVKELFNTGLYDCMYLAGLSLDIKTASKDLFINWINNSNNYVINEYIVAKCCGESIYAQELAIKWIKEDNELITPCGWNTYTNYISIVDDSNLNKLEISNLLDKIENTILIEKNRIKYTMNGFLIGVGCYVNSLQSKVLGIVDKIGKIEVDFGSTNCKVPDAKIYIEKAISMNKIGIKRKKCRY